MLAIAAAGDHSLAIVSNPPVILTPPASQVRLAGQTATFTASITGTPPYTWQWYKDSVALVDGGPVSGAHTATLTLSNLTLADAGHYTVKASNCAGDDLSSPALLTIKPSTPPGEVSAWGDDTFGQTNVPQAAKSGVIAVAAGQGHTLTLKSNGSVLAWGWNNHGQSTVPTAAASGVVAIAADGGHSLALKTDGTVLAWGWNGDGQTNVPPGLTGVTAIAAGGAHSVALKNDGTVVTWGVGTSISDSSFTPPAGLNGVVAIAAGMHQTLALKSNGTIVAWGYNTHGECDVPPGLANAVAIAAGYAHSLTLLADGSVVAWGAGITNTGASPHLGQSAVPTGFTGGLALSAGRHHTVILKNGRTLAAWGDDSAGQVSVPSTVQNRALAIAAGWTHTVAILGRKPFIPGGPYDLHSNIGADVIFNIDLDGTPPFDIHWQTRTAVGLADIPGATDTTLRLTNVQPSHDTTYTVTVSNPFGSATATARLTILPTTTFDLWRESRFTAADLAKPAISGPLADPVHTGTPNLIKYAFNLDPVSTPGSESLTPPSPLPHLSTLPDDTLQLTFHALRTDLTYTVESSTDLIEWKPADLPLLSNGTRRTVTLPSTTPRTFLRVLVTHPGE